MGQGPGATIIGLDDVEGNDNAGNGSVAESSIGTGDEQQRVERTIGGVKVVNLGGVESGDTGTDDGNNGDESGSGNDRPSFAPFGIRADGSPAKKRGRKPGSGNGPGRPRSTGTASKKNSGGINGLEKLLFSLHAMAALKMQTPEMMIDQKESELLANAITAVQQHYGFDVSEEAAIWINLATALGSVYGPRVYTIVSKRKKEKAEKAPVIQRPKDVPGTAAPAGGLPPGYIPGMH